MEKSTFKTIIKLVAISCIITALLYALGNYFYYNQEAKISKTEALKSNITSNIISGDSTSVGLSKDDSLITANIPANLEEAERSKYLGNSLATGSTPYAKYYGGNKKCGKMGCSQIRVTTSNSDVIVIIKKNGIVIRHAYIRAGDTFTFSFPDGVYQTFFYYGKGWNPNKEMKDGAIKGGFVSDEHFGKDEPQTLYNNSLEYSLILQPNGNFSTSPSDPDETL